MTSWAEQCARSAEHMRMMCEMSVGEAQKRMELFKKSFPAAYEVYSNCLLDKARKIRTDGEGA